MNTLQVKTMKLPEDIYEMLQSDEFVEKIELIGEKQSLPLMEQGFLVRICANLMKGILPPANFVNMITDELDIPREKAALIAQEINRDVFSGIKESLRILHSAKLVSQTIPQKAPESPAATAPITQPKPVKVLEVPVENTPSVFEQKLSGTFRINADGGTPITTPNTMKQTEVVTPSPSIMFTPPPPTTPSV